MHGVVGRNTGRRITRGDRRRLAMLFIEKKSRRGGWRRRSRPRAADSRRRDDGGQAAGAQRAHADLLLSASSAVDGLMHYAPGFRPETLAGFLRSGIARFTRRPNAPPPRSASESVFQVVAEETPQEDGGADDAWPRFGRARFVRTPRAKT